MTYSTLWLAQTQFFTSLGFMLLFLALELGLAWVLLYFKLRALGRNPGVWTAAYRFWVRVFALAFVLSFAASLPVLIQLGSLWPGLISKIGDIAGPLLVWAMLSAFVFKSCFLGAMLFGQRRLSPTAHTVVVALVALGVAFSTFFLLILLSWMHTPVGANLVNSQYVISDGWQVVFNPALPWYAALFVLVSFLSVGFLMMGVVAVQAQRHPVDISDRLVLKTGLYLVAVALVLQVVAVIGTGHVTAEHLPARAAATAMYWDSGSVPDLILLGLPDAEQELTRMAWGWPNAGSVWLGQDDQGQLRGLDQFAGMLPPVALTFWSFRIAVLTGIAMILTTLLGLWKLRRVDYDPGVLTTSFQRLLGWMSFSGGLMLLSGLAWLLFGALPYAVTGTITLSEVLVDSSFEALLTTYLGYLAVYGVLMLGFFQLLGHIVRYGVVPIARRRGRA
ncbi:cytochrome ubiquinol oxidase subunit I [Alcaligenaceae bacterium]|nr:cytochrome ubiquinol oxidase subunit I [Alcaligenaceae bacterium]